MKSSVRDWMINLILFIDPEAPVTEALALDAQALRGQPDRE